MSNNYNRRKVTKVTFSINFTALLTVLFIGLKLTGVIDWSWVWVLSPLWISTGAGITVLILIGAIKGIYSLVSNINHERKKKKWLKEKQIQKENYQTLRKEQGYSYNHINLKPTFSQNYTEDNGLEKEMLIPNLSKEQIIMLQKDLEHMQYLTKEQIELEYMQAMYQKNKVDNGKSMVLKPKKSK